LSEKDESRYGRRDAKRQWHGRKKTVSPSNKRRPRLHKVVGAGGSRYTDGQYQSKNACAAIYLTTTLMASVLENKMTAGEQINSYSKAF